MGDHELKDRIAYAYCHQMEFVYSTLDWFVQHVFYTNEIEGIWISQKNFENMWSFQVKHLILGNSGQEQVAILFKDFVLAPFMLYMDVCKFL